MRADYYFTTGSSHLRTGKPCQDYAAAETFDGGPGSTSNDAGLAVVSDGCSSGARTDIGARVMALAAVQAVRQSRPIVWPAADGEPPPAAMIAARHRLLFMAAAEPLGLVQDDLLATLAYCYLTPEGGFVHIQGDGGVAWQDDSGTLTIGVFDWQDNTPCYPAYADDEYRGFVTHHGGDWSAKKLRGVFTSYVPGNRPDAVSRAVIEYDLRQGLRGITLPLAAGVRAAAVFSDGIAQVPGMTPDEVARELLAFKTTAGKFAERRGGGLIRNLKRDDRLPVDDLSYAAVLRPA